MLYCFVLSLSNVLSASSPSASASIYKDWRGPVKEPQSNDRSMCSSQSIYRWTATNTMLPHTEVSGLNVLRTPQRQKIQMIPWKSPLLMALVCCVNFVISSCFTFSLFFSIIHLLYLFPKAEHRNNNNKPFSNGTCSSVFLQSPGANPQLGLTYDYR